MDQPGDAIFLPLIGLVGLTFAFMIWRRFALRSRHPGWVECGLRVVRGRHEGFASRWRNGIGWYEGSTFVWTRGPIPSRKLRLKLSAVDLEPRQATRRELWGINPNCVVTRVEADGATLEVAVLPEYLDRIRAGFVRR